MKGKIVLMPFPFTSKLYKNRVKSRLGNKTQ